MKLMHLADLHLGKRVNGFSMVEDQKYILKKIMEIVEQEGVQVVMIAGDVYDKNVPQAEAVQLLDDFLTTLSGQNIKVLMIGGNHDSQERLSFGGRLFAKQQIYVSQEYREITRPITLMDAYGAVNFYLLPFIKPAHVRRLMAEGAYNTAKEGAYDAIKEGTFSAGEVTSYADAFDLAIRAMEVDDSKRNVLLAHQFVVGAARSDSEDLSVGGSDGVSAESCVGFDYVALGHIHRPQQMGKESIRYGGTPLKYSFSEADHKKTVTIIELKEKGDVQLHTRELTPLHDMRKIKGTYLEVTAKEFIEGQDTTDYLQITLTDEEDVPDAMGKLRIFYPNLMLLNYDNKRTQQSGELRMIEAIQEKTPLQLFQEFYERQNNQEMNESQVKLAKDLIEKIWEVH